METTKAPHFPSELGRLLWEYLLEVGKSPSEYAKAAGVDRRTVKNLLAGKRPNENSLANLCQPLEEWIDPQAGRAFRNAYARMPPRQHKTRHNARLLSPPHICPLCGHEQVESLVEPENKH